MASFLREIVRLHYICGKCDHANRGDAPVGTGGDHCGKCHCCPQSSHANCSHK
jgi:hypothetical protein